MSRHAAAAAAEAEVSWANDDAQQYIHYSGPGLACRGRLKWAAAPGYL